MKQHLAATALSVSLATAPVFADDKKYQLAHTPVTIQDMHSVSPAFARYTETVPIGDLWKRPGLTPRDRSVITVATLIAKNQPIEFAYHFKLALDNGVKPSELSEIITHLAFYSGWANATAAVAVAKDVFAARGIGADQLPDALPPPLALNEENDAIRQSTVEQTVAPTSPGVAQFTNGLLFKDVWLRPDLAARDRSLITVMSLIANGQIAQVTYHLNREMDSGLKPEEASEMLTHLAFYAGWPNVFSAVPVVKDVIANRAS
ncbi:4-carboxymuconolactone decarboxylase [Agrobacterium rubi]|uniref:carboxymuconolactone decarboxylase family protein n=1 Tax=Agrobacterium rubi TaxID=28099 RepID=UPI00201B6E61|nr:carboxymuconolactone decarboxylase family protein [Agrobacterium rubi]MCL6653707.1 4-carboxymuconolactone decarboxylase [Agrobacterium rubi]